MAQNKSSKESCPSTIFLRNMIRELPPVKAIPFLEAHKLPKRQHLSILHVDIEGLTVVEVADMLHTTEDTLKRWRRKAYDNIRKSHLYPPK